jgi:4-amino-4-deoxy-L-arabinose transferase-like glycosyltransferase
MTASDRHAGWRTNISDLLLVEFVRLDRYCWVVVASAIFMNVLVAGYIGLQNPTYFDSPYETAIHLRPDAGDYVLLGSNVWRQGVYSRQITPPLDHPDFLRPPLYPLFAGGIAVLTGYMWPVYAIQVILSAVTALLVYLTARTLRSPESGLLAGLLVAFDVGLAMNNIQAMTESVFLPVVACTTALWICVVARSNNGRETISGAVIGLLLAVAAYIRPAAVYLPLLFAALTMACGAGSVRSRLRIAATILAVVAVAIAPWVARNWRLYRLPKFSTVGSETAVYYFAAGVYRVQYGISDLRDAQRKLEIDYQIPSVVQVEDFWLGSQDVADTQQRIEGVAGDVIRRYPMSTLKAIATSIPMGLIGHSAGDISRAAGSTWTNPDLSNVSRGEFKTSVERLWRNPPVIALLFLLQTTMSAFTAIGVLLAVAKVRLLRGIDLRLWCALIVLALSLSAAMILQGINPETRMRLPALPYIALLAGLGWTSAFSSLVSCPRRM